ncbi:hypothetical protein SEVIR_7G147350v4 [Setaria viridis]
MCREITGCITFTYRGRVLLRCPILFISADGGPASLCVSPAVQADQKACSYRRSKEKQVSRQRSHAIAWGSAENTNRVSPGGQNGV